MRGTRIPLTLLVAAVVAAAAVASLGPGAADAAAACKKADKPAHKISGKRARKATLCLLNKQRAKKGLSRLKQQGRQREAAIRHTRRMIKKGCFAHRCPGEGDLVKRLTKARYLPCNCTWGVAENIAYGTGRKGSPRRIVAAWMDSRGHRKNILEPKFEHIGIGIKRGTPGGSRRGSTYTTTFGFKD